MAPNTLFGIVSLWIRQRREQGLHSPLVPADSSTGGARPCISRVLPLDPLSPFVGVWSFFACAVLTIMCFVVPYEAAFVGADNPPEFFWVNRFFDIFTVCVGIRGGSALGAASLGEGWLGGRRGRREVWGNRVWGNRVLRPRATMGAEGARS